MTPGAQDARVEEAAGEIRIRVGAPPEGGKANAAAQEALAHALGVAKGRLTLVRGVRARSKLFRLD